MELAQEARELGCWAVEEMGVPVAARAPESTLRRNEDPTPCVLPQAYAYTLSPQAVSGPGG
ncbi:HAUS augmin like complex subunit 5 [Homo sapiens]|uniref:HAUS augmin like complex subunit 5 n=1 Tax=Homo sapiens TaxID=9606 RepID=U3KQJ5_HUMAN|nr:HAUS augmin like complex subunit 5 [Homo sapiens]KAI4042068.1 HAUS augmin like complex subunit 5 [Homo sapiens]